jgi:hypothetical protein
MSEPRIALLPGDSGRSFAATGLVVVRESKDFFRRTISNPPTNEKRDFEATLAWRHETIHFVQSISTAYLYSHSVATVRYAFNILDNFQEFLGMRDKTTMFESVTKTLSSRENGISIRDLLEGVAVVESFKMNALRPTVAEFLRFRNYFFPGDDDSCYRRSFDYVSEHIGQPFAYHLLAPLSFIALQSDNPPESFRTIVEGMLSSGSLDHLVKADVPSLFSYFGMNAQDHMLYQLDAMPVEMRHPVLYAGTTYAISLLGIPSLLEMTARPAIIESSGINQEAVEALLPPVVAFSSSPGSKLEGMTFGSAKRDKELLQLIVHTTGLIGAAERLTLFRDNSDIYQFCPHGTNCPHYASALCFNYFSPPSIELGYANCGFIRFFESRTKMKPNEAWTILNFTNGVRDAH